MSSEYETVLEKFDLHGTARSHLVRAGKLVTPLLPKVLDHFYKIIAADPEMAAFFPNDSLLQKAKEGQQRHWELLLSGEFGADYFASAYRIGRIHPRIGLPFLFYLSGYAHATSYIQELVLQKYGKLPGSLGVRNLPSMLSALTRAFALDTHLVLDAHFAAEKEEQDTAFEYLTDGISRMAAKDLTQLIPAPEQSNFPVRFNPVRESFNELMTTLRELMSTIQDSSSNLNYRAKEVAQAIGDLSSRTESQAATLEETAAAVEEISVSMRSSADATTETNRTVNETRSGAEQGSKVVGKAVQKMGEIEASSNKISQIITVIDDIAFQTNLLALNAGVEAARAGDSGRGFAVVASEVRGLAQRSAESANEIKSLISESSEHVEHGVTLVSETGKALNRMVGDIRRTAELTVAVSNSAQEQATGLNEINIGVTQLDAVTQQNAAMVEQTTAAAVSMQRDVNDLSELVGSFLVEKKTVSESDGGTPEHCLQQAELRLVGNS
ncbi:globin-coupled sensor protein [Pseudophaeobacter sp.]|uniref:globin-coupled sensor protein n=1 Tax=Pseudophaeobacter sp. TaxID=1971739 RepID=UPI0032987514